MLKSTACQFAKLTKGDSEMAGHKSKVDELPRNPQRPQSFAAVPDLVTPFVVGMLQRVWLPLHQALDCVERREVYERMTAAETEASGTQDRVSTTSQMVLYS